MGFKLTENSYGKSVVRLTKVTRRGAWHDLLEMSCDIQLQGDFESAYANGDNTNVVATDSIKNTVYILAKETQFESIEHFGVVLAQHFVNTYAQVSKAVIEIEAPVWQRIDIAGRAHEHAFTSAASEKRVCNATLARGGEIELEAGFSDLSVIKTTA
ncbi:MAG TPA: urate oxidase, partial [Tepidisphaeraceae bacterium]|nr:urate oxidase [Tepidisphaeraceae bacterium]